jgi:hypothetical protein
MEKQLKKLNINKETVRSLKIKTRVSTGTVFSSLIPSSALPLYTNSCAVSTNTASLHSQPTTSTGG